MNPAMRRSVTGYQVKMLSSRIFYCAAPFTNSHTVPRCVMMPCHNIVARVPRPKHENLDVVSMLYLKRRHTSHLDSPWNRKTYEIRTILNKPIPTTLGKTLWVLSSSYNTPGAQMCFQCKISNWQENIFTEFQNQRSLDILFFKICLTSWTFFGRKNGHS